jgi:hypothetical protein
MDDGNVQAYCMVVFLFSLISPLLFLPVTLLVLDIFTSLILTHT